MGFWKTVFGAKAEPAKVEAVDVVELLARVIEPEVGACKRDGDALVAECGLRFVVQLGPVKSDDRGVRTSTTIEVSHPAVFPDGVFEWQHSFGDTVERSVTEGFEKWAAIDLCAVVNSLKEADLELTSLELTRADARVRRVVFSPVLAMDLEGIDQDDAAEHPFGCPCCMFVKCLEVMTPVIDGDGSFGVRLYAGRMTDGSAVADCRVNGEDFPAGVDALKSYVATWPGTGVRSLKQYVVVQTIATN